MFRLVAAGGALVVASALAGCGLDADRPADGAATRSTASSAPANAPGTSPSQTSVSGGLPMGLHPVSKDIGTGVEINVAIKSPNWQGETNGG